jgi:hypothetical protein
MRQNEGGALSDRHRPDVEPLIVLGFRAILIRGFAGGRLLFVIA